MKFAKRTDWDLTANAFSKTVGELRQAGQTIYDLTVSNPTQCGLDYPQEELLAAFYRPENMLYDPAAFGLPGARQAVAQYYRTKGVDVPVERILLTASTSEAYGFLFRLLADPQDQVAFPKPSYPLFEFLAGVHDMEWTTYNFVYEKDRWALDRESLIDSLKAGVRAMILVNPNNPTGSCLNAGEIDFIFKQCRTHEVPVICDEVFLDYLFSDSGYPTLASSCAHLTFVLGGLSKSFALPQMKLSWIVANGPQAEVREALKRLEVIADTFLSVNVPVENALPQWMAAGERIRAQVLQRVRANRQFLANECRAAGSMAELLEAQGGWSAMVRINAAMDEEDFVLDLLRKKQTCVHPGYFFDCAQPGMIVLSLLPREEIFQEGVCRLAAALKDLS
ncbi:MAG TPA: pyridoxal phosphate-dependent aminotransferase [Candidatus Bathyarchaeia archaeon]|nr:pyridoxal phosphate-dependent aminotransferase [Candidatus Bathyarchaeia archaeon]